jgi:hypothetical protein
MIGDAIRSSLALASRLEGELAGWHRREGHSASVAARDLAQLTLGIASKMRSEVEALLAAHQSGSDPDLDDIVALNKRALMAEQLHALLESSTHRSLHPVLSPTVRTELAALNVSGQVLVAGVRDVSYEVGTLRRKDFARLVPNSTLDAFAWPLFIFRVPNEPLDWPLHHVLLYHEIGHALVGSRGGLPVLSVPAEHDPSQGSDLEEQLQRAPRAELFKTASASWLEEFYADAVGLCLAGPAYIIAFARLLGTFFRLDVASETHPPVALRIKLLVNSLKEVGFDAPLPTEVQSLLDGWSAKANNVVAQAGTLKLRPILNVLLTNVEQEHEQVLKLALAHVGERTYAPTAFQDDWERGRLLASLHIPPIEQGAVPSTTEAGQPLDPSRIFSACWAAYLLRAGSDAGAANRFAEAIMGSLEGADALRIWREP